MSIGLSTSQDSVVKMKKVHYINPPPPPPPPLGHPIQYKKKGKFMGFNMLGPITDKIKIGGGYFTSLLIYKSHN